MKYTREELNDFIKEMKNFCISNTYCEECPFYNGHRCTVCGGPSTWAGLKPEKKLVPFDFSLKEDRDALIGKRIYSESENDDRIISKIYFQTNGWYADSFFAEELLDFGYVFADTGKPVGKEIEE